MSILVIGDIHVKKNNLQIIDKFKIELEKCINKLLPSFIVFLGDNLDKHDVVYTICYNRIQDIFNICRKKAPTYIIVGNHDMINPTEFLTTNHWLNSIKEWDNVHVVDKVIVTQMDKIKCTLVPFVPNGRFKEALNTTDNWMDSDYIFAHQEFKGCNMGAFVSEDGDEWETDLPLVVSGHIHSKQSPQQNIYYTGSAIQHAFGESTDKTLLFIKDEKLSEISLKLPKKKILYSTIEDISTIKLDDNNEYKIIVSGNNMFEFKKFTKSKEYKKLLKKNVKVEFKQSRKDLQLAKQEIEQLNKTNFSSILYDIVSNESKIDINDYRLIFN